MNSPARSPRRGLHLVAAGAAGGALGTVLLGAVDALLPRPVALGSPLAELSLLGLAGAILGLLVGVLRTWPPALGLHPFGVVLGAALGLRVWLGLAASGAGLLGDRAASEALRGAIFVALGAALGQLAGLILRRALPARSVGPNLWRDLAIVAAVAAPNVLARMGGDPVPTSQPNVLLITVDTLRADRLGYAGHASPTSPNLDRLARRSTTHVRGVTPQPRTLPGLASLLTGRVPPGHGVRDNFHYALGPDATTLAERLAAQGWVTASVNSSPVLAHDSGIHQGFASASDRGDDWARLPLMRGLAHVATLLAMRHGDRERIVTDLALAWLERRPRGRPFFLWVHYLAPHMPYEPARPFDRRFDPAYDGEYRSSVDYGTISKADMTYRNPLAPRTLQHVKALYDGEVATSDRAIGRLLRAMEARAELENTIVVVSADHGESLDEHGYFMNHGDFVYGPAANVPLIWSAPGSPARVVPDAPSLIDVFALVLDLLELGPVEDVDGRWPPGGVVFGESDFCRFPDVNDRLGYLLPVEIAQDPGNIPDWKERWEAQAIRAKQRFVEAGDFKLVLTPRPDGDRVELFDLRSDPGETRDISRADPALAGALSSRLETWMRESAMRSGTARDRVLDEALREQMGGLGYLGR